MQLCKPGQVILFIACILLAFWTRDKRSFELLGYRSALEGLCKATWTIYFLPFLFCEQVAVSLNHLEAMIITMIDSFWLTASAPGFNTSLQQSSLRNFSISLKAECYHFARLDARAIEGRTY
jgi:hypothetical protein